jgi:hypothetical protein
MLSRNGSLSVAQLKTDLLASVDQEPQFAGESMSGGELDAAAAVALAGGDAPYAAPGNRVQPAVSGAATAGSTLTVSTGSWSRAPTGYAFRWERCWLGICLPVPGATGPAYTLASTDIGATFYAVVTASNATGATRAISTQTNLVQVASPSLSSPNPTPSAGGGAGAGSAPSSSHAHAGRAAKKRKARTHAKRRQAKPKAKAKAKAKAKRRKGPVKSRLGRSARS